jgi:uncharacterized protein
MKRGFGAMDPIRQKEIASMGGKAAHVIGTAHKFTSEEAKIAGKKGGLTISSRPGHMSRIGKIGGERRGMGRRKRVRNVES